MNHKLTDVLGILRPQFESDLTIGDRTPSLFLADLISLYSAVLPPLVEKKKKDADRVMPVRKRTVLVDQRISRRNISEDDDTRELLERQMALQHPSPQPTPNKGMTPSNSKDSQSRYSIPISTSTSTEPPSIPSLPASSGLGLGLGFDSAPTMKEPKDSDDEAEPPFNPHVIPPTPAQNTSASIPTQSIYQEDGEGDTSATADILDGLVDGEEDAPIAGAVVGSSVGLKRATSGDVSGAGLGSGSSGSGASRLRGPRAARGPRPAGGRGLSMGGSAGLAGDEEQAQASPSE